MIPQRNLSRLANRLAEAGGRRLPEAVLERDYCLAWFLVGLSRAPLREDLAFKGGTALKRCYFGDYRFSEDLDFTLEREVPFEAIRNGLDAVFAQVRESSGIEWRFARQDDAHRNSYAVLATQEIADAANSPIIPTILSACPTKIYLPNEEALTPQIASAYRGFGLTDAELEILAVAQKKRDYYYRNLSTRMRQHWVEFSEPPRRPTTSARVG